jgi:hypothetical protein
MYRGLTSWLLACAGCGVAAAGCSDAVVEPIRHAAASSMAEDAGREPERDGGRDGDGGSWRDRDASSDEQDAGLDAAHCAEASSWLEAFADAERELLESIQELREGRVECGDRDFSDLRPLRLSPALQCSARLHSLDMARRDFVGRTNPDGEDASDRMRAAGFEVEESSESIVVAETEPGAVLEQLLDDWDDCMNVATDELDEVGIGRHEGLWTLDFGRD